MVTTTPFGLQLVHALGDQLDVLRAFRLRQGDRLDAGADHRFEVAHRHAHRPVQAYDDIGAAARHELRRFRNQGARPLLLRGGDAVFEVENDGIGAALRRAFDKATLRHRHE